MFGGCFALNDEYRKRRGSGFKASIEATCIGAIAGLLVLLIVNGLRFEFTWFTLAMGVISAFVGIGFTFCSFKALDVINLSLFSLFSMLGGMALPFAQGILFYGEQITVAKIVCVVLIVVALLLTVSKGEKKRGTVFYIGIFILNGASGVLAKIFTEATLEKTSSAGYSIWIAICTVVISGIIWFILERKSKKENGKLEIKAISVAAVNGSLNRVANFLLVLALAHVDASVQYPMVTGGVMIVSTAICFFGKNKPSKKELLSVAFAFLGMLALFVIPV